MTNESKLHGSEPAKKRTLPRLLSKRELCSLLDVSVSTLDRRIRSDPSFPQARRLPYGRTVRFIEAEVIAYMNQLPAVEYEDHSFDPNDPGEE
jgi:predicted DNA-binding transcriptional regulator AlpA